MPSNRKRLFLVLNDFEFLLSHRMNFAQAAQADGYAVTIVTPPDPRAKDLPQQGFSHLSYSLSRRGVNPFAEIYSMLQLYRLYLREQPDIIHHFTIKPVIYGSIAAIWAKQARVFNTITGLGFMFVAERGWALWVRPIVAAMYRFAFRRASVQVIFQNPDDRALFLKYRLLQAEQTHVVLGSGVDPEKFRPSPLPAGDPVVLYPGRMLFDKGLSELVEAAKFAARQGLRFQIWLAGPIDVGNPASIPEQKLRDWEKLGFVRWLGKQSDMPRLFAESHIVCLPSYREGVPRALLEAAASGRAILTTDVPGCREVVVEGVNGYLVPARESTGLGRRLVEMLSNREMCQRFGEAGRERALQHFSLSIINAATLATYQVLP